MVNEDLISSEVTPDSYVEIERKWKKGDVLELNMEMPVRIVESNPLVEENRNQVAVRRGPLVYCLEGVDIQDGKKLSDVVIPADIRLIPVKAEMAGHKYLALEGIAKVAEHTDWKNSLYQDVATAEKEVKVRLIPYYIWGNRGETDMSVCLPVSK